MFLLCEILINIVRENDVVINDNMNNMNSDVLFHEIVLDIKKISLIVLIVGGAEMLIAMNVNHQKVILGVDEIIPLNDSMFREEYFI